MTDHKAIDGTDRGAVDWLTIREVAAELRSSVSHVKTLLGQRGGPVEIGHFKHGRRTLIKRKELERYKARVEISGTMRSPQIVRRNQH